MVTPTVHRDPDIEFQLDYLERTAGSGQANIYPRFQGLGNWLAVEITDAQLRLIEAVGWTQTVLDTNTSATTTNGQWYTLRIVADGADITVYRQTGDGVEEEVLSGTTGALASGAVAMTNFAGADHVYNDVRILADDLNDSYTYDYNGANELTSSTGPNGTTTYGYDDWGRMTSKSDGTRTATYDYRYDGMLYGVDSNFIGEGDVDYEYGGQRKRRSRTVSGTTTKYNWDAGWNLLNEEDGSGNLTRTFFHDPGKPIGTMLAHVDGTAPSTTDFLYYFQDNIGSTTQLRNEDNTFAGDYEYTPYGQSWQGGGATTDHQFTGKYRDTKADLYYFPYRHYNPSLARWTTPDPLGMVDGPNLYAYVGQSPIANTDPTGLFFGSIPDIVNAALNLCQQLSSNACIKAKCAAAQACYNALRDTIGLPIAFGACILGCAALTGPAAPICIVGCIFVVIAGAINAATALEGCKNALDKKEEACKPKQPDFDIDINIACLT